MCLRTGRMSEESTGVTRLSLAKEQRQYQRKGIRSLAIQGVAWPAASPFRILSEKQNLWPHPRPTESEYALSV